MSEKELSKAFLRGEGPIDLDALTSYVLRRDRRRIWLLAIGCVIAWMLVVMLPWSTVLPMLAKIGQYHAQSGTATAPTTPQATEQSMALLMIVKKGTLATFAGSIASMFLAAVCTVSLIVLSRRATLRQVNMRLQEISTQIKGLAGAK